MRGQDSERASNPITANVPFSTKSFNPAPSPSPLAGSQPRIVDDSIEGGGLARNDSAKTGVVEDSAVGGVKRW